MKTERVKLVRDKTANHLNCCTSEYNDSDMQYRVEMTVCDVPLCTRLFSLSESRCYFGANIEGAVSDGLPGDKRQGKRGAITPLIMELFLTNALYTTINTSCGSI